MREKFIVNLTDQLTGLHRNFHLFIEMRVQLINDKAKVLKLDHCWFAVRLLHIVNEELLKVTCEDPARSFRVWQISGISFCLLKWGQ